MADLADAFRLAIGPVRVTVSTPADIRLLDTCLLVVGVVEPPDTRWLVVGVVERVGADLLVVGVVEQVGADLLAVGVVDRVGVDLLLVLVRDSARGSTPYATVAACTPRHIPRGKGSG